MTLAHVATICATLAILALGLTVIVHALLTAPVGRGGSR
jgi:hypothetical protein